MTDLRDRIVEAVEQDVSTQYYAVGSVEVEGIADAVLAVLADLPDDVIERAARALFEDPISSGSYTWAEMVQEDESRAELWRDDACRILKAAFGGEQA